MIDQNTYARRLSALRGWLRSRDYHRAIEALEYARRIHVGYRKDGITESFAHQVDIAFHIVDLSKGGAVTHVEDTLIVAFLHDTIEDYGQHHQAVILDRWGQKVHDAVMRVTKKIPIFVDGRKVHVIERDEDQLYAEMARCPMASLVKPADRSHNQKTMDGVHDRAKQVSIVQFTEARIIPMMHEARQNFPAQYASYMLIQDKLESQITLVRSWAAAA